VRRIEGKPLPAAPERLLERLHGHARFNRRREIARLVLDEPVEAAEQEDEPQARGRRADGHGSAATPGRHRHARLAGRHEDGGDVFLASGRDDGLWRASLDDIGPALDAGQDMRGADDTAKLIVEGGGHGDDPAR